MCMHTCKRARTHTHTQRLMLSEPFWAQVHGAVNKIFALQVNEVPLLRVLCSLLHLSSHFCAWTQTFLGFWGENSVSNSQFPSYLSKFSPSFPGGLTTVLEVIKSHHLHLLKRQHRQDRCGKGQETGVLSHFLCSNDLFVYVIMGLKISNPDFWPSGFLYPWNGRLLILPARGLRSMFTKHILFLFKAPGTKNYFKRNWSTMPAIHMKHVWNIDAFIFCFRNSEASILLV